MLTSLDAKTSKRVVGLEVRAVQNRYTRDFIENLRQRCFGTIAIWASLRMQIGNIPTNMVRTN